MTTTANRIRKLLALADGTSFPYEAEVARKKAEALLATLSESERMQIQHSRALRFMAYGTIEVCPDGHWKVNWRPQ